MVNHASASKTKSWSENVKDFLLAFLSPTSTFKFFVIAVIN